MVNGSRVPGLGPVVRVDFSGRDFTDPDALKGTVNAQLFRIERITGVKAGYVGLPEADRFALLLEDIHRQAGQRVECWWMSTINLFRVLWALPSRRKLTGIFCVL